MAADFEQTGDGDEDGGERRGTPPGPQLVTCRWDSTFILAR